VNPSKSFACIGSNGALNHSVPKPLTRIEKYLEENVIAVQTLDPRTPWAASAVALPAAIPKRRKK
jgi:hypothetical protein